MEGTGAKNYSTGLPTYLSCQGTSHLCCHCGQSGWFAPLSTRLHAPGTKHWQWQWHWRWHLPTGTGSRTNVIQSPAALSRPLATKSRRPLFCT